MPRPNEETMTQSAQAVRREALTEVTLSPTRYVVSFRQACLPRACRSGNFEPNRDLVLNLKAWKNPAPWTFGNGPRTYGNLRPFHYLNEDISIIKRTPVNDRVSVELRADFLNIFNRIVFGLGRAGTSMVRY